MVRLEPFMRCVELNARDGNYAEVERLMSMLVIHSNYVDSNLSTGKEAACLLRLSSTLPAAHSINTRTNSSSSFSLLSGSLLQADQRSAPCRLQPTESDERYDSEQSARTRDDEHCFERIMWSAKEISGEFLTACGHDQDNHSQLSENWFQKDAWHYDEQQKKKRALNLERERSSLQQLRKTRRA